MDDNDLQPENIPYIVSTLETSHLEISGNIINEEQLLNIESNDFILEIFQFDISGNDIKDEQP